MSPQSRAKGRRFFTRFRLIVLFAAVSWGLAHMAWSAELPMVASRDITLSPPNGSLHDELQQILKQYRGSLNSVGLSPSAARLAQGERKRMMELLNSRGYYNAEILHRAVGVDEVDLTWWETLVKQFKDPVEADERVQYRVDTGPQYQVLGVSVEGVEVELPEDWPDSGEGDPLVAEKILEDQSRLQAIVDEQSCYFTLGVTHRVRLNEEDTGGHVTYQVTARNPSEIGEIEFKGDEGVNSDFLRRQTSLKRGECFSRADIDQAVLNLYQTRLFAAVSRSLDRDANGNVRVNFDLVQRPPRTLRAGAGWDTDQGFGLTLGWEHRNLLGRAQRLELSTELQQQRQEGNARITLPGFLEARNTLVWNNKVSHEALADDEYYLAESRATINRRASPTDSYTFGIAYRRTDEFSDGDWESFSLLRFPLAYEYDENRGDFSPRSGKRYRADLEPVWSLGDDSNPYLIGELGWSSFRPLGDDLVLANQLGWTSIWPLAESTDLDQIPPSDRLLAGGGGSVRGYPYRSIGIDGSEDGGTQKWSGSLELRGRFAESWGATLFTDVASVSEEWSPTQNQDWFTGVGAGVRYYTQFAPIRFDLAFPVNRREDDPSFQIYLSLGQSF